MKPSVRWMTALAGTALLLAPSAYADRQAFESPTASATPAATLANHRPAFFADQELGILGATPTAAGLLFFTS